MMNFLEDIKITIPEGKKLVGFEHYENRVVINFEDEFKDGDYITVAGMTFISKNGSTTDYYVLTDSNSDLLNFNSNCGYSKKLYTPRLATVSEISMLDDRLRKIGTRWNPETKTFENLPRWRAMYGQTYYTVINNYVGVQMEYMNEYNSKDYKSGNYFKSYTLAKKAADEISKIFDKYKEY